MLLTIHVKNFALIDEAELSLGSGVQILTGETGAGKSILIDAVTAALGGKVAKDVVRKGADSALVELVFEVPESRRQTFADMDIPIDDDGQLIVSRKITDNRSISKMNGMTVTLAMVRQATGELIDIHGQHEHQSLLYKSKHLEILDEFTKGQTSGLKRELARSYEEYTRISGQLKSEETDEDERLREMDFCRYEIQEIENARLSPGEEEELSSRYRLMTNSRRIVEGMNRIWGMVGADSSDSASEILGSAAREMGELAGYDSELADMKEQLSYIDSLVSDVSRQMSDYIEDLSFDADTMRQTEERLDQIHSLQARYGSTYDEIMESLQQKKDRLEELEQYDERRARLLAEYEEVTEELDSQCAELSEIRRCESLKLVEAIRSALTDLNFLDVQVSMEFTRLPEYHRNGYDEAEFMISLNPGEECRPLRDVASGGELSRIMLAIKSVLADTDEIPTLIFDEIDTGISGRTAQKVAEKMTAIGRTHQVLCITHLAQIAAMADRHFLIEKKACDGKTVTQVTELNEEESVEELARLTGGAEMTDTGYLHARELKEMAERLKKNI